jgi:trimeric autotransporter adhesin
MYLFTLSKALVLLPVLIWCMEVRAQENCFNGIDDNGNGLIDLNDPQCTCNGPGPLTPVSLLPNPSFEQYTQCPTSSSQAGHLVSWQRALQQGTVDYLNTCGYTSQTAIPQTFVPTMDGNGCIGIFTTIDYKEFIGSTCLPTPLASGTAYTLKFDAAFTKRRSIGQNGCPAGAPVGPMELTLYGAPSCYTMPLTYPPLGVLEIPPPFVPIGNVTVYPVANQTWEELVMTFVPTFNVAQVILGPAPNLSFDYNNDNVCSPYFLIDNLRLNTTSAFNEVFMEESGDICMGTANLTAYGGPAGGSWQWYKNGIALIGQTSSSLSLAVFGAGEYTVRKMIGNTCYSATKEVNLSLDLLSIHANVLDDNISACQGEPTLLTAMGADTYTWSPATYLNTTSGDTVEMNPQTTTTYVVTGHHGICSDTDTITVNVIPIPELTLIGADTIICAGETSQFLVSGGIPNEPYYWTSWGGNSALYGNLADLSPIVTTTYVVAQNIPLTSCSISKVFTITVTSITGTVSDTSICEGGSVVLDLTGAGGSNYSWSPATGLNTTSGPQVIASPLVSTDYFVDAVKNGCPVRDTIRVTVISSSFLVSATNGIICPGESILLTATGASSYSWSPVTGLNSISGSNVIATPAVSTIYTVVGTTGSCSDSAQINITVTNGLTINADGAEICPGETAVLNASGAANYSWTPATGLSSTTGNSVQANPAVTTTYTITGTTNGCTGTTTATVIVKPAFQVQVNNATICPGYSATLNVSGADTYSWSPITGLSSSNGETVIAQPSTTTVYTVTGTQNGCSASAQATVTVTPGLELTVNDFEICSGGQAVLIADGAESYNWNPAVNFLLPDGSKVTTSPTATTVYTVTGTNSDSTCSGTAQAVVELVTQVPMSIQASPNPVLADHPMVTFIGEPSNEELIWIFGDGNSAEAHTVQHLYPADSEAVYQVMLIVHTAGGCIDTTYLQLVVENGMAYYVPNSFTPNGDAHNSVFKPFFSSGFDPNEFNMVIYNRWGEIVFESKEIDGGWDGSYRGLEAPDGTYTWTITVKNLRDSGMTAVTGSVTLLR